MALKRLLKLGGLERADSLRGSYELNPVKFWPGFSRKMNSRLIYDWEQMRSRIEALHTRAASPTTVFLARHGATTYNQQNKVTGSHNVQLVPKGEHQARELASRLADVPINAIFSSGLDRAIATAQIFVQARNLNLPIVSDFRLNEVDLGKYEGSLRRHLEPFAKGDIDFCPEGGESYRQAAQRVCSFLLSLFEDQIRLSDKPRTVVVFAHAGVMRIARSFFLSSITAKQIFSQSYANAELVRLESTSFSIPAVWTS